MILTTKLETTTMAEETTAGTTTAETTEIPATTVDIEEHEGSGLDGSGDIIVDFTTAPTTTTGATTTEGTTTAAVFQCPTFDSCPVEDLYVMKAKFETLLRSQGGRSQREIRRARNQFNFVVDEFVEVIMEQLGLPEDEVKSCFDTADFACSELCVVSEDASDYVDLLTTLVRERIGQCNRYGVWMDRLDELNQRMNLTLSGEFLIANIQCNFKSE